MAKLPDSIVIGQWHYSVTQDAQEWAHFGVDGVTTPTSYGMTNSLFLRIAINPAIHPRQKADTLLHEVLHCVWDVAGVVHKGDLADHVDVEEMTIGQLTPWLAVTLVANPRLIDYLRNPE